jgi:hypothetical protein
MKSIRTQLEPVRDQVLEVTKKWGRGRAMDTFGIRDWGGFDQWLYEVTGIRTYGLKPIMGFDSPAVLLDQTLDKFLHTLQILIIENKDLRQENRFLKHQLEPRTENIIEKLATLADACEPEIAAQLLLITDNVLGGTDGSAKERALPKVRHPIRVDRPKRARQTGILPLLPEST